MDNLSLIMTKLEFIFFFIFFTSTESAFGYAPASLITPAPKIIERQYANNICGYYSANGQFHTITCALETPCLTSTLANVVVAYCSNTYNKPVTSIYAYGNYPLGGCQAGSACCPANVPTFGEYLFNDGSTIILGCSITSFKYSAFTSPLAISQPPSPTSATTTPSVQPITPHAQPTSPAATQDSNSGGTDSTALAVIIAGAVVTLIGGLAFLFFLYKIIKARNQAKNAQWQYPGQHTPISQSDKASTIPKWQLTVGIISASLTAGGLIVTTYFAVHRNT